MGRDSGLDRRAFIGLAATTLVGTWAAPALADGGAVLIPPSRLGIQLFTIRDKVSSLGFAAVFAELQRIGYHEIEFAGYGTTAPADLRQLLSDHDLRGIGSHIGYFSNNPAAITFATNLTRVLDDAQAIGLPHIGTASSPARYGNTIDAWKRAAAEFNTYGAAARERGMKFYQHNHAGEFGFATDDPSVRLYDVLLAETDPELVFLEMDVFWAYQGQFLYPGFEPLDYVQRHPDRYPLFHIKDGRKEADGFHFVDVGDGDIDYQHFIGALEGRDRADRGRGSHHYLVERDDAPSPVTNPAGSFSTAQRSFDHLRALRD